MAITDHNKSKVAEQIAALSDNHLIVLPGMEVSLKTTFFPDSVIHVLAIFPQKYGHADIDRVFAQRGMPIYAERTPDTVLDVDVGDFVDAVHALQGICIASHVNTNKGIRHLFRNSNARLVRIEMRRRELSRRQAEGLITEKEEVDLQRLDKDLKRVEDEIQNQYLQFLAEYRFDAIEVQTSNDRRFYSGTHVDDLGLRPIPCVMGSDSHNLTDIGMQGSTTYAKMTCPSFPDLKKALRDPGTRLRFEDDVHSPPVARLLGVQFDGGFFNGHTVGFADNLSCLIGGRGSGKSATIEALRYVFDHSLQHLHKSKQGDIHDRLEHTLRDTEIKVAFVDSAGDTYVLKRRYGEKRTACYERDGTIRSEVDVPVASNLQVRIFGWGEIEELARSKRDQLALIDGFAPNVAGAKLRVQGLLRQLASNTDRVVGLAKDVQALLPQVVELPAKRVQLSKLTSDALDKLFLEYDQSQRAFMSVEALGTTVSDMRGLFVSEHAGAHQLEQRLSDALQKGSPSIQQYAWYQDFEQTFRDLARTIEQHYKDLLATVQELAALVSTAKTSLSADQARIDAELNRVAESETTDMKSLLSKRKTLTDDVNALQVVQGQIDQKQQEIDELLRDRWDRIVPELQSARREVTALRRAVLKDLNDRLSGLSVTAKVTVGLLHQKERRAFELMLGSDDKDAPEGLLKYVSKFYRRDKYAKLYAARHSPHSFVQAVLKEGDDECRELRIGGRDESGRLKEVITQDKALDVRRHLNPRLDDRRHLDSDKLRRLLELEHCDTEDLPSICLDGKSIEGLSPGQRCSALIPIILLEGDCPVLIDQPEDNLDNRLVFGLVVDIIRSLKERRQIIVATHNPNIPVSGDAEQILVFDAPTRERCDQVLQGSIDCDDIVEQVKAIMEGSEDAFRIRAEKYGYSLPVPAIRRN